MRILYHHRTLGDGAEGIHIREMVRAFRMLGHDVLVAGPVGEQLSAPPGSIGRLARLKKLLPGFVFELIEITYSFVSFVDLSRKVKAFQADLLYDRYITFNVGALWAARWAKIPLVLEVNAPLALERSSEPDERLFFQRLAHAVEQHVCSKADWTLVVSTPLKEYLEAVGVPKGKCIVMPNGVDQSKFRPRPKKQELMEELDIPLDATVIGFTGILRPWHGLEMLVEAVATMNSAGKSVFLLIVGDGPIREKLEDDLREAGLYRCSRVTGRVSHEEVADYVSLFDVAVSPKATFYASPMKIIEYMSSGKSVVATDTNNIRDLIEDGDVGILFQKDSVESLTSCLSMLSGSEALRQRIGQKARRKVETRLNWEWNANEVVRIATSCSMTTATRPLEDAPSL